jgi:hypothetical protein
MQLESTNWRDKSFSRFVREALPSSKEGLVAMDCDWIFLNYKQKILLSLEVKHLGTRLLEWQTRLQQEVFGQAWRLGLPQIGWMYAGHHYLIFNKYHFDDGATLGGDDITKEGFVDWITSSLRLRNKKDLVYMEVDRAIEENS